MNVFEEWDLLHKNRKDGLSNQNRGDAKAKSVLAKKTYWE